MRDRSSICVNPIDGREMQLRREKMLVLALCTAAHGPWIVMEWLRFGELTVD